MARYPIRPGEIHDFSLEHCLVKDSPHSDESVIEFANDALGRSHDHSFEARRDSERDRGRSTKTCVSFSYGRMCR